MFNIPHSNKIKSTDTSMHTVEVSMMPIHVWKVLTGREHGYWRKICILISLVFTWNSPWVRSCGDTH